MSIKKLLVFALALSIALSLAACGAGGDHSGHNTSYDAGGVSTAGAPGDNPHSASSPPAADYAVLYETYADISALPILSIDMDDVCVFEDRTLTLEALIQNEPELCTYNLFYCIASAQFDLLMEAVGDAAPIQTAMNNESSNFEEGRYFTETTIHTLTTLTAEDLSRISDFTKEDILTIINTFGIEEYVVVAAEKSWKYNEAYASAGPQLEDGEQYMRYYLFAKTAEVPEFKLYEVYWEDFFAE